MNSMLNKTISSFETMPSYDMDFQGRNDDNADEGQHDFSGYHVVQDSSEDSFGYEYDEDNAGILIVSPKNSASSSREVDLSVPDSVPSDLNSIPGFPNHVLVPGLLPQGQASDEEDEDLLHGFHERNAFTAPEAIPRYDGRLSIWKSVACALLTFTAAMYVVRERGELQKKARDLDELEKIYMQNLEAINLAKEQEEKNRRLEEQIRQLQDDMSREQAAKESYGNFQSRAGPSFPFGEETPLLDNCWVHARAQMEFGECTKEATKTVKKHASSWIKSIDDVRGRVWKQVQQEILDAKTWYDERGQEQSQEAPETEKTVKSRLQNWGKSFTKSQEQVWTQLQRDYQDMMAWYTAPQSQGGNSQQTTTRPHESSPAKNSTAGSATANATEGKTGLGSMTKSFLTTVALGTAATLLLSAVDWMIVKDEPDEERG
jgi:hypothetical protein